MEVSILSITRRLGVYGPVVLLARGMIEEIPRAASGQLRRFRLVYPLPNQNQFEIILQEHFSLPVFVRLHKAYDELETLGYEVRVWYDLIPESLIHAERHYRLSGIAQLLAGVVRPDVPSSLSASQHLCSTQVFMAPELGTSRTTRHSNAVRSLEAVILALRNYCGPLECDVRTLISYIISDVGLLAGIRYPTRYY